MSKSFTFSWKKVTIIWLLAIVLLCLAYFSNAQTVNKPTTTNQTVSVRCKALTKQGKGDQCKRMTTLPSGYCTQHDQMVKAGTLKGQK